MVKCEIPRTRSVRGILNFTIPRGYKTYYFYLIFEVITFLLNIQSHHFKKRENSTSLITKELLWWKLTIVINHLQRSTYDRGLWWFHKFFCAHNFIGCASKKIVKPPKSAIVSTALAQSVPVFTSFFRAIWNKIDARNKKSRETKASSSFLEKICQITQQ